MGHSARASPFPSSGGRHERMPDQFLAERLRRQHAGMNATGFNPLDFIHAIGSPLEALLYGRLLWPEFTELEDMVFLRETLEDEDERDRVQRVLRKYENDRSRTERECNLVELPYLFGNRSGELDAEGYDFLANLLMDTWRWRLGALFPSRQFVTHRYREADVPGPAFTFYQPRTGAPG